MLELIIRPWTLSLTGPNTRDLVGYDVFLRLNNQPWSVTIPLTHYDEKIGVAEAEGKQWTFVRLMNWRKVVAALAVLGHEHLRHDAAHALRRAVSPFAVDVVTAEIVIPNELGRAHARYTWRDVDLDHTGRHREVVEITVNEGGGMRGGATFEGTPSYPVPGYDLAWNDDSSGR